MPFAGHRDSVSELVGDVLESAIEDILSKAGISYRKTKRAEKTLGSNQTPDFIIPSEFKPQVVIEAKLTEDDGAARDKVTRVQHLAERSRLTASDQGRFEVIACIGGRRGFGVPRGRDTQAAGTDWVAANRPRTEKMIDMRSCANVDRLRL